MRRQNWYTLDNSAKLMPSMTNNLNTNVFRLTCTLKEKIDEVILQESLNETVKEFPLFLYSMKDGLFWHYLEKIDIKPKIELLNTNPCARIDNGLMFKVMYYKCRIHLEVYHVLSDGNGAMEFLKYLVCTYISKKYCIKNGEPINDTSKYEKSRDDFKKFDRSNFKIKFKPSKKAYKLNFTKKDDIVHDVIEAHFSVCDIKNEAKRYGTTVTIYLVALLIKSIIKNARVKDLKRPIGVTVPVDLRHIFPSKTSRNFFYTINVQYKGDENSTIEDMIASIKEQFEIKLSKENLQELLNTYMIIEKLLVIRLIPNFIKDLALSGISKMGKRGETIVLSNLGVIKFPKPYEDYIESFTALMSTEVQQVTVNSFNDTLVLGFTSHLINKELERTIIGELQNVSTKDVKVISNMVGESDD